MLYRIAAPKKMEMLKKNVGNVVTLIFDFIATESHYGHFFEECCNFFSGDLFNKIALTICKGCLFV